MATRHSNEVPTQPIKQNGHAATQRHGYTRGPQNGYKAHKPKSHMAAQPGSHAMEQQRCNTVDQLIAHEGNQLNSYTTRMRSIEGFLDNPDLLWHGARPTSHQEQNGPHTHNDGQQRQRDTFFTTPDFQSRYPPPHPSSLESTPSHALIDGARASFRSA